MGQLRLNTSAEIKADSERIWEIVADQFVDISLWARDVNTSANNPDAERRFDDAPTGGRICEVNGFGELDERIIHFDVGMQEITWSADSTKIPGFVSGLQNAFTINRIDAGTTRLTSLLTAHLSGIRGMVMGPLVKRNFSKAIAAFMDDLDVYVRTGDVSEVKKKQLASIH